MRPLTFINLSACLVALAACGPVTVPDTDVPPPPPTPLPDAVGLLATHVVWEWEEDARPSALAASGERLGVMVSDGRFLWLDAATGRAISGGFIWPDDLRGETWGSVLLGEGVAVVAAAETFQPELGDFPETRARVIAFDDEGNELWTLPELGDKHLYSVTIAQDDVLVGTHRGFAANTLSAYDAVSGEIVWRYEAENFGFEKLVADDTRVYAVLIDADGGGLAAYDLFTGALLWAMHDPELRLVDDVLLEGGRLYVLTQPAALAMNPADGQIDWAVEVGLAPEAGVAAQASSLYVVPAPTGELGNRPGLLSVDTQAGVPGWNALAGLVADPLAASGDVLWAIVKDPDEGSVALSVLEADTGLERARLPLGEDVAEHYSLVADGDTVYVLGASLRAYRVPR